MLIDEAKKLPNLKTQTGACRFCGQIQTVEAPEEWSGEMIECMATELCECNAAKAWTRKREAAREANDNLHDIFEDEDICQIFGKSIELMGKGAIASVTIDFGDGVKGQVKVTNKGAILIRKTRVTQESKEV